jgi:hypothetical protein
VTVQELIARFPEIPDSLREEPLLGRFAEAFDDFLRAARNPSACATEHDAAHRYYLKLIGPMSILGYGLTTRERVLVEIQDLLDRHRADPDGFAASLLS